MAPRPTVGSIAEELYGALGPWASADTDDARFQLLELCEAVGGRLQPVEDIIRDSDDGPGWSSILDADRAPADWLPWLANLAGGRLLTGLPESDQRDAIKSMASSKRGSPGAIRAAAEPHLSGTKTVYINERAGSAYRLSVVVIGSEAADLAAVERAVQVQKPAGIVLTVESLAGAPDNSYKTLKFTHSDYQDLKNTFVSYAEIKTDSDKQ